MLKWTLTKRKFFNCRYIINECNLLSEWNKQTDETKQAHIEMYLMATENPVNLFEANSMKSERKQWDEKR